jgi:two-component system, chemotaxis family, response regulator WspF
MRIAVVNGSAEETGILVALIKSIGHEIAWFTADGSLARRLWLEDPPQLILLDLMLQGFDVVQMTAAIKQQCACAVIVVAPSGRSSTTKIFQALTAGAIDFIPSPTIESLAELQKPGEILHKICLAAQLLDSGAVSRPAALPPKTMGHSLLLVVIGASTGGPAALAAVLCGMSRPLPAAVVIIQHIDLLFSENLAKWLAEKTALPVTLAKEKEKPEVGQIMIAGTNDHLVLTADMTFHYSTDPVDYPYRPSIDRFFESVSFHWPWPGIAVLLTGMGKDGAAGLLMLREAGWHTIAQDRNSSAVYGMPAAAQDMGAAVAVLPLAQIGPSISRDAQRLLSQA